MNRFVFKMPLFGLFLLLMQGCASLPPSDPPSLSLTGIEPELSKGAPRFIMSFRVVNPNDKPIKLAGAAYTLALNDYDVVAGATSALPEIPAYGEAEIKLPAELNLLDSMRLASSLLGKLPDSLDYKVSVKLDTGGLWPAIRLTESGQISAKQLLSSSENGQPL